MNPFLVVGTLLLLIEIPLLILWLGVAVGSRYHRPLWRFFKPFGLGFGVATSTANLLRTIGFGQTGEESWQLYTMAMFLVGVAIIVLGTTSWPSERA